MRPLDKVLQLEEIEKARQERQRNEEERVKDESSLIDKIGTERAEEMGRVEEEISSERFYRVIENI